MARLLFGRGARGPVIERLQQKLTAAGFDTKGIDGIYFGDTTAAVTAFQKARGIAQTGEVDETTWLAVMGEPLPPVADRCIGLTAAFEGHDFHLAQGNFDGAGITWGIIGFTLEHGELTKILNRAFDEDEALVRDCFGEVTDELLTKLNLPSLDEKIAWASSISLGEKKVRLAEPYRSGFGWFGKTELGKRLQLECAHDDYYVPARATAKKFGLRSEVGTALCFDIHVQNGGIKKSAATAVKSNVQPGMPESAVRLIIANAVADNAKPKWRDNVRRRKVAIATGNGTANGITAVLKNWGLDEFDVT